MPLFIDIMPISKNADPNLTVCTLVYDGLCSFEYGICAEVFGLERPEMERWYDYSVCALDRKPMRTLGGLALSAPSNLNRIRNAGTVLIPGWRGSSEPPQKLLDALVDAYNNGARLLSICSGVFVLAATGLLAGKQATTHWRYCEILQEKFPDINVQPDVLYVDEGQILTSAGSAAGLDLCLHLVRRDWGSKIANSVARRLVLPAHREGGQVQYIERPVEDGNSALASVMDWARGHLDEPLDIDRLADRAGMSIRTLSRRFQSITGLSPGAWVQAERVNYARDLLEQSSQSVEQIAMASGFNSANALRHHFRQRLGTSPNQYRKLFLGQQ